MHNHTLVILAAGLGSRYGGLKQLDGIGPNGETIMEYSLYDAHKAGINRFVFVIRESFEEALKELIISRLPKEIRIHLAYQDLSDLPSGCPLGPEIASRTKPWGTGHAVRAARGHIDSTFMVINADDYYGSSAFQILTSTLSDKGNLDPCMVGFALEKTLSASGTVSRGVCEVKKGKLKSITERVKLHRNKQGVIIDDESKLSFSPDTLVSMNCWGFDKNFFDFLEKDFTDYLRSIRNDSEKINKGEYYLPAAVDRFRTSGLGEVSVRPSPDSWLGVTYPEDRDLVASGIAKKIAEGKYPEKLWS